MVVQLCAKVITLKENEWGLASNFKFLGKGEKLVYPPGTYYLDAKDDFIIYPSDPVELKLSPSADFSFPDTDGRILVFHFKIEYLLDPKGLPKLYSVTDGNHEKLIKRIAYRTL